MHDIVHQVENFVWHHRDLIVLLQFLVFLSIQFQSLSNRRDNRIFHDVELLLDNSLIARPVSSRQTSIDPCLDTVKVLEIHTAPSAKRV